MKQFMQVAFSMLLSLALPGQTGQPSLTGSCRNGGTYPSCDGGEIVFSGSPYAGQVHVQVTNSSGAMIDDGYYTTAGGVLKFVENLSFADTYTIAINDQAVLSVTTR